MKLSLDLDKAINARMLVAEVLELNQETDTATINVDLEEVAEVPIHYFCHHGVDNHATSRVFKVGDQVLVLYQGNGLPVSKDNLKIMGLKDEIRRCRAIKGICCSVYGSALLGTFSPVVPYPKATWAMSPSAHLGDWIIDGLTASKEPAQAGLMDWYGSDMAITWNWSSGIRYTGVPAGNSIYYEGVLEAKAPSSVLGAALKKDTNNKTWIVVGCVSGSGIAIYKKVADGNKTTELWSPSNTAGWVKLGDSEPIYSTRGISGVLCFNPLATQAVASNGKDLCHIAINWETGQIDTYIESPSGNFWWPFADFNAGGLVRCVAEMSNTGLSPIWDDTGIIIDDTTGTTVLYQTGHSVTTSTIAEKQELKLTAAQEIIAQQTVSTSIIRRTLRWYRRSFDAGVNWGDWYPSYGDEGIFMRETTVNNSDTSTLIVDLDIRYDFFAGIIRTSNHQLAETIIYNTDGSVNSNTTSESSAVSVNKIAAGEVLATKNIGFEANGTLTPGQPEGYYHPSVQDNAYTSLYKSYFLDSGGQFPASFTIMPVPWFDLADHGYSSVIRGGVRFTCWILGPTDMYVHYSIGTPSIIMGVPPDAVYSNIKMV